MRADKRLIGVMFTAVMVSLGVMTYIITVCSQQEKLAPSIQQVIRNSFLQSYVKWDKEINSIFIEKPFSSIISKQQLKRIEDAHRKHFVPLGPSILPYIIIILQEDHWIEGAAIQISKFKPHDIILSRKPGALLSTTEEFPEVVEKMSLWYDPAKAFLHWWLKGQKRTPEWFAKRYNKWLLATQQGNTQEAQIMYQKLLNIGIAAISLWLEKLQIEQDEGIRQAIMEALVYLTNGEVNQNMSVQDCLNWWKVNKERWTIPFPKSKREFLNWLEREGWEEPRLAFGCVITISRLEDEAAIDAMLRFLKHPDYGVRSVSLKQLQKLFGEQLPKEYALGVGTDEWEKIGDLIEAGKYDFVRKRLEEVGRKVKDSQQAMRVADELFLWWQNNKGKIKIYWQRAWESICGF